MNENVRKWVVDMDRMIKIGSFYTLKQSNLLERKYLRLGYSISFDHDDWMCIERPTFEDDYK